METKFKKALAQKDYQLASDLYRQSPRHKEVLQPIWHNLYKQKMVDKEFSEALALAVCFEQKRQWVVPPSTSRIEKAIAEEEYKRALKWLVKYPADYFSITKTLSTIKNKKDPSALKMLEALEPRPRRSIEELMGTLQTAVNLQRKNSLREGHLVKLPEDCELMISGDLHGNRNNLDHLLEVAQMEQNPKRHVVFQEVIHSRGILIDQRDVSFLEIIDILKFMAKYPGRVHFLVGNHDLNFLFGRKTYRKKKELNALFYRGVKIILGHDTAEVVNKYMEVIIGMAAAIKCGPLLLTHSNPTAEHLKKFDFEYLKEDSPFCTGDCIDKMVIGRDHSDDLVKSFLQKTNSEFSIIGHEICRMGYEAPNARQIILDSCHNQGYYLLCNPAKINSLKDLKRGLRPIRPE